RGQLVAKLQKLSVDYYDRQPVGVLMSRVAHDTEALYGLVHQLTGGFLMQVLQLLGVGVMLFTLNARLALWTLIPMPFVLYGSWSSAWAGGSSGSSAARTSWPARCPSARSWPSWPTWPSSTRPCRAWPS